MVKAGLLPKEKKLKKRSSCYFKIRWFYFEMQPRSRDKPAYCHSSHSYLREWVVPSVKCSSLQDLWLILGCKCSLLIRKLFLICSVITHINWLNALWINSASAFASGIFTVIKYHHSPDGMFASPSLLTFPALTSVTHSQWARLTIIQSASHVS